MITITIIFKLRASSEFVHKRAKVNTAEGDSVQCSLQRAPKPLYGNQPLLSLVYNNMQFTQNLSAISLRSSTTRLLLLYLVYIPFAVVVHGSSSSLNVLQVAKSWHSLPRKSVVGGSTGVVHTPRHRYEFSVVVHLRGFAKGSFIPRIHFGAEKMTVARYGPNNPLVEVGDDQVGCACVPKRVGICAV